MDADAIAIAPAPATSQFLSSAESKKNSMVSVRLSEDQPQIERGRRDPSHDNPASRSHSASSSLSAHSTASGSSSESGPNVQVDWIKLDKHEEEEPRDEGTDEATALLLARLEEENAALAGNPKSNMAASSRPRTKSRPVSVHKLKKLVNNPSRKSLHYSQLPAPHMTELEFWAALVADYPHTVQRLPTLTSNKIRSGVPPPLRGVVWPSITGAGDAALHDRYNSLCGEPSPYDGMIDKDVGRSFPNVDMFRDKDGEGQQLLGRVLKSFSLYDQDIGYCQGLGFVVGPLLMHMDDARAFCILVRLMENYDLRSCYLPDLAGLHLRIYQFQQILSQHLPELAAHLESLKVEPLYVSQWFLSFFAVTCPLPMLLRIYDVVLSEGATETLMRVALSLMKRNEQKITACTEFEDIMQFLLSRSLWDTYAQEADELVSDFTALTAVVTRESLKSLESSFRESKALTVTPSLKVTASNFLGRFWAGSTHSMSRSGTNLMFALPSPSRPTSFVQRRPSKNSLLSNDNSDESHSDTSTLATEVSAALRQSETVHSDAASVDRGNMSAKEKELESQIEDLLKAMSDMQHRQNDLFSELQREREERQEDRDLTSTLLRSFKTLTEDVRSVAGDEQTDLDGDAEKLISQASQRFDLLDSRRVSILPSKHQLRDEAAEWKDKHDQEAARCQELSKQLDEWETDQNRLREQLREARSRVQDAHKEKQRMEKTIQDLRSQRASAPSSPHDVSPSPTADSAASSPGLREFKLGRADTLRSPVFNRRSSSLNVAVVDSHAPAAPSPVPDAALLGELANAKTSEALARQELEEVKGRLEAMKKIVGGSTATPSVAASDAAAPVPTSHFAGLRRAATADPNGPSLASIPEPPSEPVPAAATTGAAASAAPKPSSITSTAGSFFSGWTRRAATASPA